MKSITTCPSCQTTFLVTDEQLSQYNGKVRCGHCLNVFNAIDYITVPVAESQQSEVTIENPTTIKMDTLDEQDNAAGEAVISSSLSVQNTEHEVALDESIDLHSKAQNTISAFEPEINRSESKINVATPSIHSADVLNELFAQVDLPFEEILGATHKPDNALSHENSPVEPQRVEPEINPDTYQEEISNINTFDYKPEYQYYLDQKKSTSPFLRIVGVLFVLLALLQLLFFYRDTIAMHYPESKPSLVSACQVIGCKINLPKEIQSFSIDDSTIGEDSDHQGVIRLTSTITNRANFNQEYPNLEITLTDTQDKPTLRRIVKPNEYLKKDVKLDQGIASGDSIEIDMPLMADDFKPAGFRLLVSY